jgi:hypothetical protein
MNFFKKNLLIGFLNLIFFSTSYAQLNKDYLTTYDSIIEKKNLIITNGLFHINNYRINNHKNIYYKEELFVVGEISYLGQNYYDLKLKFDIYNDDLIFNPIGNSENSGVILIKPNVLSFSIHKSKFVNLDLENKKGYDFINGYYEEKLTKNNFAFYIKHKKSKKKIIQNKNYVFEFNHEISFVVLKDEEYSRINSKASIIEIFPESKKIIIDYFKNNRNLKKSNSIMFYTNLFKLITL